MMNKEGLIYTVVVTFVVSFVFVGALAFANELTKERTAMNELLFEERAVLSAMGIQYQDDAEVFAKYAEEIQKVETGGLALLKADVNGRPVQAIKFTGSGLWGEITGILAVEPDLSRVVGLDIIDHNETPGLGGRIADPWFKEQFRGERILDGQIRVAGSGSGDPDPDNGIVDAVTGASRTSDAVEGMLNATIAQLQGVVQ